VPEAFGSPSTVSVQTIDLGTPTEPIDATTTLEPCANHLSSCSVDSSSLNQPCVVSPMTKSDSLSLMPPTDALEESSADELLLAKACRPTHTNKRVER